MERVVWIPGPAGRLEARIDVTPGAAAAVLCHPHPQFGGSMDNNVVHAARRAAAGTGMTTLRFNFRGVGGSEGTSAGGEPEADDVLAAVDYVRDELHPEPAAACLVGYSFGAWAAHLAAARDEGIEGLVLISPPVAMLPLAEIASIGAPVRCVTGTADTYAPPDGVRSGVLARAEDATLDVIEGCDHLYVGFEAELEAVVARLLADATT